MPATTAAIAATQARGGRRFWFDLHSWVGLKLCLMLGFVFLTGTLAVLAHEIDWLLHEPMRVAPDDRRASWGEMADAVRRVHPHWALESLEKPEGSRFAARATVRTPEGRTRYVWVDPYRGRVTGDTGWFNVHRFLRNTHRHLMMPAKIGIPIVTALSIPLLLTWISSLFIYKRWWRGFFAWPRADRPRRLWGDVHRLLGVWSLAFLALMASTGVWYLVESLGGEAPVPKPYRPDGNGAIAVPGRKIDVAVAQAHRRWPAFDVQGLAPAREAGVLLLFGQADAVLVRPRANAVAFEADSGRWLDRRDALDLSVHQRISEMADPLHFGNFAGLAIKLLWFAFGAALTALSLTGAYLYGLRISEAWRSAQRRGTPA